MTEQCTDYIYSKLNIIFLTLRDIMFLTCINWSGVVLLYDNMINL